MKRISSRATFFYKRICPLLAFAVFVLIVASISLLLGYATNLPAPLMLILPTLIAIIGLLGIKRLIPDLVDQVWDAGDALIVRDKSEEDRVLLSDIMTVSYSTFVRPPRVTLQLRTAGRFGDEISFVGPVGLLLKLNSARIEPLIARIDAARQRARSA